MPLSPNILIVGQFREEHLGFHFQSACKTLGIQNTILDLDGAKSSIPFLNRIAWNFFDRSYFEQKKFQKILIEASQKSKVDVVLVLGTSAVNSETLKTLRSLGKKTINFLSDDPWNSNHLSKWFMDSLPEYDILITPRRSNFSDLERIHARKVFYLPFAYNPLVHFEETVLSEEDKKSFSCDVMFFGGADKDRLPYIRELIKNNVSVKLFGGYWDDFADTRPYSMGIIPLSKLRKAVKAAKLVLNLVRRANRDGHVMRTFEGPAMGGCLLNERTDEHLAILGENAALFFSSPQELIARARTLLDSSELRAHYCRIIQNKILSDKHTYADRLKSILEHVVV